MSLYDPNLAADPTSNLLQSIQQAIVDATLSSTTSCQTTISGDQTLTITCRNDQLTDHYESNPTCVACVNNKLAAMKSQFALQFTEWNVLQPSTIQVKQDINASYTQFMDGLETCVDVCKMCKLADSAQTSVLQIDASCQIDTEKFTAISNDIVANLSSGSYLSNEMIDQVIASLSGGNDRDKMRLTLAQLVNNNLSVDVVSGMLGHISSKQSLIIQSTGAVTIKGLQQSTVLGLGVEFLASSKFTEDITNTVEWEAITKYFQENRTLSAIGETVIDIVESVGGAIEGVIEVAVYTCAALLVLIVILLIMTAFIK